MYTPDREINPPSFYEEDDDEIEEEKWFEVYIDEYNTAIWSEEIFFLNSKSKHFEII